MRLPRAKRVAAIIPTASMADIAFLLIIFFMVTTVHEVDRTRVDLPSSSSRADTENKACYVVVNKDRQQNTIVYKFSNGEEMSRVVPDLNMMFLEASAVASRDRRRQFVIKADGDIRYQLIDEVMDQLRRAGVEKLLLLSQQEKKEGA